MCLAPGPQRSGADEARTRGPSVSSQALNALYVHVYNAASGSHGMMLVHGYLIQPGNYYFIIENYAVSYCICSSDLAVLYFM